MAGPARILVVDDSKVVLTAAEESLKSAGYEVVTRESAIGTGAAVLRVRPDVVIIDVSMPALDGPELVTMLRRTSGMENLSILLWSDRDESSLAALAAECGADGYVRKERDFSRLIAAVRALHPPSSPEPMATQPSSDSSPTGPYVLLVDGDPASLKNLQPALHSRLRMRETQSALEALRLLRSETPPLLVVANVQLPDLSGIELLKLAMSHRSDWEDHFIFTAGSVSADAPEKLRGIRCPILFKPLDITQLLATVRAAGGGSCITDQATP